MTDASSSCMVMWHMRWSWQDLQDTPSSVVQHLIQMIKDGAFTPKPGLQ